MARPYLASFGMLQTVKIKPALVWEPGSEKVVVLSPHMDDEVIGCGGTVARHVRSGADVTVVFMTDGRFGSNKVVTSEGAERERRQQELMLVRKQESERSLDTLGVQHRIYLDATETMLRSEPGLCARLRGILEDTQPQLVYVPFFLEEHPDHRETNQILLDAVEGLDLRFNCCGYEVWTPLFPNCLVDITEQIEVKTSALSNYRSQLADKDYLHTSLGLNAYRSSSLLRRKGYVEAFYVAPLAEYRRAYEDFGESVRRWN